MINTTVEESFVDALQRDYMVQLVKTGAKHLKFYKQRDYEKDRYRYVIKFDNKRGIPQEMRFSTEQEFLEQMNQIKIKNLLLSIN